MIGTIINIVLWISTIGGYVIYNLYQKNLRLEQALANYEALFLRLKSDVQESDKAMQELDKRGIFKGDDEVGAFFKLVMEIQQNLNNYFK